MYVHLHWVIKALKKFKGTYVCKIGEVVLVIHQSVRILQCTV